MKIYPRSIDLKKGNDFSSFTITNSSKENKLLLFKVRRSDPKVVSFNPHFGVVQAGCTRSVALWLTDTQAAQAHVLVKFVALRKSKSVGDFEQDWRAGSRKGVVKKVVQLRNLSKMSAAELLHDVPEASEASSLTHEQGQGQEGGWEDDDSANISLVSASTQASAAVSLASTQLGAASVSTSVRSRIGSYTSHASAEGGGGYFRQRGDDDSAFSSSPPQRLQEQQQQQDLFSHFDLVANNVLGSRSRPKSRSRAPPSRPSPQQEQQQDLFSQEVDSNCQKTLADVASLFSLSAYQEHQQHLSTSSSPQRQQQQGKHQLQLEEEGEDVSASCSSSSPQQLAPGSRLEDHEQHTAGDSEGGRGGFDLVVENSLIKRTIWRRSAEEVEEEEEEGLSVISDLSQGEHDFDRRDQSRDVSRDLQHESITFPPSAACSPASASVSASALPTGRSTLLLPRRRGAPEEQVGRTRGDEDRDARDDGPGHVVDDDQHVSSYRPSSRTVISEHTSFPSVSETSVHMSAARSMAERTSAQSTSSSALASSQQQDPPGLVSPQRSSSALRRPLSADSSSPSRALAQHLPRSPGLTRSFDLSPQEEGGILISTGSSTSITNSTKAAENHFRNHDKKKQSRALSEEEDVFSADMRACQSHSEQGGSRGQADGAPCSSSSSSLRAVDLTCRSCSSVQLAHPDLEAAHAGALSPGCRVCVFGAAADDTVIARALALRVCALLSAGKFVTALTLAQCPLQSLPCVLDGICPSLSDASVSAVKSERDQQVQEDTRLFVEQRFPLMVERVLHVDQHQSAPSCTSWGWDWDLTSFYQTFFFEKVLHFSATDTLMTTLVGKSGFNCFQNLEFLDLSNNKISIIDQSLDLPQLKRLDLSGNLLQSLDFLQPLLALQSLHASRNRLASLHTSVHVLVSLSGSLRDLDLRDNRVCSDKNYLEETALLFPLLCLFDGVDVLHLDGYLQHQHQLPVQPFSTHLQHDRWTQVLASSALEPGVSSSPPPPLGTRRSLDRPLLRSPAHSQPPLHLPLATHLEHKTARLARVFARVRKTHGLPQPPPLTTSLERTPLFRASSHHGAYLQQFGTSSVAGSTLGTPHELAASLDAPSRGRREARGNSSTDTITNINTGSENEGVREDRVAEDALRLSSSLLAQSLPSAWASAPLKYPAGTSSGSGSRTRDPSPARSSSIRGRSPSPSQDKSYMKSTVTAQHRLTTPSREQAFKHRSLLQQARSLEARRRFERRNEDGIEQKRGEPNCYDLRRSKFRNTDSLLASQHKRARRSLHEQEQEEEEVSESEFSDQQEPLYCDQSSEQSDVRPLLLVGDTLNTLGSSAALDASMLRVRGGGAKGEGWSLTFSDDQQFLRQVKQQISHSLRAAMASSGGEQHKHKHRYGSDALSPEAREIDSDSEQEERQGVERKVQLSDQAAPGTLEGSLHMSALKPASRRQQQQQQQQQQQEEEEEEHEEAEEGNQTFRYSWDTAGVVEREWVTVRASDSEIRVTRSLQPPNDDQEQDQEQDHEQEGVLASSKNALAAQLAAMQSVVGALHSRVVADSDIDFGCDALQDEEAGQSQSELEEEDCDECARELAQQKHAFLRSLDLDSFVQLKQQLAVSASASSKSLNSSSSSERTGGGVAFPQVFMSPKRRGRRAESPPRRSFSHEEESSLAELMDLLGAASPAREQRYSRRSADADRENDGAEESGVERLLARLLREELQGRDEALLARLLQAQGGGQDIDVVQARPRPPSRIPKLSHSSDSDRVAISETGEEEQKRSSDQRLLDHKQQQQQQEQEEEEQEEGPGAKPRKRSASPSVLNLLLPLERHKCQFCSPAKTAPDPAAPRSESPPWNPSTRLGLSPPCTSSSSSQPSDFFHSPQPKRPFSTGGVLRSATPSKIPKRRAALPGTGSEGKGKSREQLPGRASSGARASAESNRSGDRNEGAWVPSSDVVNLLQSYHHVTSNASSSGSSTDSSGAGPSFRLRHDFSAELARSPPPTHSPSQRSAPPSSTTVFSPSRAPLPRRRAGSSSSSSSSSSEDSPMRLRQRQQEQEGRHRGYHEFNEPQEHGLDEDEDWGTGRAQRQLDRSRASNSTRRVSADSSLLHELEQSQGQELEQGRGQHLEVDVDAGHLFLAEEEEEDSLFSVIRQFSLHDETQRRSQQYEEAALSRAYSRAQEEKEEKEEEDGLSSAAGGGEEEGMDRYLTWLTQQSGPSKPNVHAKGGDGSHFENNLSAWRLSNTSTNQEDHYESREDHDENREGQQEQELQEQELQEGDGEGEDSGHYSDDFDPEWKEDARVIARNLLGLSSAHASSPFADLQIPSTQHQQQQQQGVIRPPLASSSQHHHQQQQQQQQQHSQTQQHVRAVPPPYGMPLSVAGALQGAGPGLGDSGAHHSPLPLGSVRHPRHAALTPSRDEREDRDRTPPSALFSSHPRKGPQSNH